MVCFTGLVFCGELTILPSPCLLIGLSSGLSSSEENDDEESSWCCKCFLGSSVSAR